MSANAAVPRSPRKRLSLPPVSQKIWRSLLALTIPLLMSGCLALSVAETGLSGWAAWKADEAAKRPLWTPECTHKPVYIADPSSMARSEKLALGALNSTLENCID